MTQERLNLTAWRGKEFLLKLSGKEATRRIKRFQEDQNPKIKYDIDKITSSVLNPSK